MLYLASSSARRHALLAEAGLAFVAVPPGPEPAFSGTPAEVAARRAESKAAGARATGEPGWVLGADTVVDCAGSEIGKPRDRTDARAILTRLAGRDHVVHTAICLVSHPDGRILAGQASSAVRCAALEEARLEAFLDSETWRGKAGAYGIQDPECDFMSLVAGELDTVIGLPVGLLRGLLSQVGQRGA